MDDAAHPLTASGRIWRWDRRRGTGMIETVNGDHIWFGLNAFIGRDPAAIAIGDRVDVDYEAAEQDSHRLRAIRMTWI